MSIKTLHITNAWHAASGGVGTFYRALLSAANEHRQYLRLIVPKDSPRIEAAGVFGRIYYVAAPSAPFDRRYRIMVPHNYRHIRRILREERPDVVEICDKYSLNYIGGLLREQWLLGSDYRPTVIGLSCERMDENVAAYLWKGRFAAAFCQWYMKWLYFPMYDHHITVSDHTAAELAAASHGHKVRRGVWVYPMGVDFETFSSGRRAATVRREFASRAGGNHSSILLLYSGRLAAEKNLSLIPRMMADLLARSRRDYRLLIAGQGPERDTLERELAAAAPGRTAFLGHISGRESLADLYANADIFVHPNPREPFGIAPLEAMAAGLALVAPHCGGVATYANDDNAWLCDPSPEAFATAIESVTADPETRFRKLSNARASAAVYRWPEIASGYLRLYEELHRLRCGAPVENGIVPCFYSTQGNWLGMET